MAAKGKGTAKEICREDDEPVVEVSTSVACRDAESKAISAWLQRQGKKVIGGALGPEKLGEAIFLAVGASAPCSQEDAARRVEEQARAEQARGDTGEVQAKIAAAQRQQEADRREAAAPKQIAAVEGSVWNENSWHWEEKPMTTWAVAWL